MKSDKKNLKGRAVLIVSLLLCGSLLSVAIRVFGHISYQFVRPFLQSLLLVMILTPIVRVIARKARIMDIPAERKIHTTPVPLLGGVAIYVGFMATVLLYVPLSPQVISILIGGSIIFVLSTIDDMYPLSSIVRLIGQIGASLIVISSGLIVSFTPGTWWGNAIGTVITIVWILTIVNGLNFADGVDGLAVGMTIIMASFFAFITYRLGQHHVMLPALILVGCGLGFILYNFKPAKIYLGDGGSTFIGFLLATFALYGGWSNRGLIVALGIPVLIVGILIFDMVYITLSRIKNGVVRNMRQWLDHTAKDHFHHRLMNLGFSEPQTVFFIYITCFILGLSAIVLERSNNPFHVVVLIIQASFILVQISVLMIVGRQLSKKVEHVSRESVFQEILAHNVEVKPLVKVSIETVEQANDEVIVEER
ncbi:MAG: undecaprenyl/decaprenyl-phosphate alpha-N-acetylglucosaminyl 1-phosphate transferase [Candidatus Omnitrophica bacterium]|nr:undecaprenyl/decaprenyl-phosphate alpha-N-acetylglucosaminyl 1-phosphate transferase [Candidatus Omnitrophota bacterium]